jgi:phospholipase/carboxylesterase
MILDTVEHQTGPAPQATILVLHGLGADGHDFEPLCDEIDVSAAGDVRWVLPHAPTRPVTLNGGLVMRAWYDILGLDLPRREDEAGLRASQALVEALIARERSRGIPSERIVLMGFSQGCAMTLLTGLRHEHRLAGLVGLSGYLPLADTTEAEAHAANRATPVFLAHGRHDPVIPLSRALASRDHLLALGVPVSWHEYPIEHAVCAAELADLQRFLVARLTAAGPPAAAPVG